LACNPHALIRWPSENGTTRQSPKHDESRITQNTKHQNTKTRQ
jgi:hypothetical protein